MWSLSIYNFPHSCEQREASLSTAWAVANMLWDSSWRAGQGTLHPNPIQEPLQPGLVFLGEASRRYVARCCPGGSGWCQEESQLLQSAVANPDPNSGLPFLACPTETGLLPGRLGTLARCSSCGMQKIPQMKHKGVHKHSCKIKCCGTISVFNSAHSIKFPSWMNNLFTASTPS